MHTSIRQSSRLVAAAGLLIAPLLVTFSSPASAAVSPTEQWITSVSGANNAAPADITFGTTGVTASLEGRPGTCDAGPHQINYATLTRFNTQAYWSPQAPTSAVGVLNCISPTGTTTVTRDFVLNKPLVSPVIHVNNLDGSTLTFDGINDAGAITLAAQKENISSQIVGGNQLVPRNPAGSTGCRDVAPGPGVDNSSCGSYRMTQDGGPVSAFSMTNTSRTTSPDGWYWSMSFPTASLTKAFDETTVDAGEATDLTFTITNPANEGAVDLTGMSFTDTLPTGLTAASATLADNGSCGTASAGALAEGDPAITISAIDVAVGATCTLTVSVRGDAGGTYTNAAANLSTNIGNLVPSGSTTLLVEEPDMTLVKDGVLDDTNDNDLADSGETITYTFTVTNTGNVVLPDVSITDPKVADIAPATHTVPVGGVRTFSGDYEVTQADIDAGTVRNEATASGGGITTDVAVHDEATIARVPGLTVDKSSSLTDANDNDLADVGETMTYSFAVTNTGNVTLNGVTVDDPKVGTVSPDPVTLGPAQSQTFTASYVVTAADVSSGEVFNSATASAIDPVDPTGPRYVGPPDTDEQETVPPSALLTFDKTAALTTDAADDDLADLGDVITYTFTVTNDGNVDVTGVTIDDPRVTATTPTSADVPVGETETFTATYAVTQDDIDSGAIVNTASASGSYTTPDGPATTTSADDSVTTDVDQSPELEVVKDGVLTDTNGNTFADVGEEIVYTFTVFNRGNTTLTGVNVVDARVDTITPTSVTVPVGGQTVFTSSPYVVTQADVDAGSVTNSAIVRGAVPGGPEAVSPPAVDVIDTPPAAPDLEIEKTASLQDANGNGTADAGEEIIYSFLVTNTGNVTLADVSVRDDRIAGLVPADIDALAPGDVFTFTAEPYVVTDADVTAGGVTNVASALGTAPGATDPIESDPDEVDTATTPPAPGSAGGGGLLPATGTALGWMSLLAALVAAGAGGSMLWRRTTRTHAG